jgi:predicted small secreted protein
MKKTIIIIGIAMAVCFTMGFTMSGFGKDQSSGSMQGMTVEKAFASEAISNPIAIGEELAQGNSIFSWSTILYLSTAVIGIVAFRRNTYV